MNARGNTVAEFNAQIHATSASISMARTDKILEYDTRRETSLASSSTLGASCAISTLITSIIPIWCNFASVWLVPGYIGSFMVLTGLQPLWKGRRWGVICALVGSVLLLTDLAFFVAGLAETMWRYSAVVRLDLYDILTVIAFALDILTIITLVLLLRHRKG